MEYTQWGFAVAKAAFNGGLNPCCNGIYSMRKNRMLDRIIKDVLILVVMEYTQWVCIFIQYCCSTCLNPCCNGIYSMSY